MVKNDDITNNGERWIFSDTARHIGNWTAILALEDSVITELRDEELQAGTWDGETITKGTYLPGQFTAVQLASGKVVMYG